MHTCWTRTDQVPDSAVGVVDMGFHYGSRSLPTFTIEEYELSEATGGAIDFALDFTMNNHDRTYLIFGSMTGTEPGTPLPGGQTVLPLNWDLFTNIIFGLINSPFLQDFQGTLNNQGDATAQLNTFGPLPPGVSGNYLYFASLLSPEGFGGWNVVSNPVAVKIVP